MRILKFLFTSLIFFLVVGAGVYFGGREILLMIATSQMKSSVTTLRNVARNTGTYLLECRQKLTGDQLDQPIDALQIRFTSDTTYQVEVVCQRFYNDPIVISEGQLPPFVTKIPGYSGLIWGEEAESAVGFEVRGRQQYVVLAGGSAKSQTTAPDLMQGPVTSCSGYGFTCCNPDTSQGSGQTQTAALDCPATCFAACQERPTILSLTTEPFYNPQNRIVTAPAGDPIMFNYLATSGENTTPVVEISYGDGQTDTSPDLTGQFTHTYQCDQAQCQFTATLTITESNVRSVANPLSQVTVVVTK